MSNRECGWIRNAPRRKDRNDHTSNTWHNQTEKQEYYINLQHSMCYESKVSNKYIYYPIGGPRKV